MLVVVARGGEQVRYMVIVQRVVGVPSGAPHADEAQGAQEAQMVRGRARRELGGLGKLLDRAFAIEQLDEQPQPARRREGLERLGELGGFRAA